MKLSQYSYQVSVSRRIKCIWNYGMKLSIESEYFVQVLFYSVWHDGLGNSEIKLFTETGLRTEGVFRK
jgi:hypothetical protein